MVTTSNIMDVLLTIPDPEMPISIVDLGLIEDVQIQSGRVSIDVLPTFVGCPALPMIADDITRKVGQLEDVENVEVRFIYDPPWTVDRISETGRLSLKTNGVTVPEPGNGATKLDVPGHQQPNSEGSVELSTSALPCPFCESRDTKLESQFGPTRCRMMYYCNACRNTFEHMKKL